MRDLSQLLTYTAHDKQDYTVPAASLDYCVKLDGRHVKLSWLSLNTLNDITEHF